MKLCALIILLIAVSFDCLQAQVSNLAIGRPTIVDSNYRPPENIGQFAVDGNKEPSAIESRWVSGKGYPHFIEVEFDRVYDVFQVAFYTGHKKYNHPVKDYQIQYWNEGEWIDIVSKTDNNAAVVFESFNSVATDRIRLYATRGSDDILRIYELEVYGLTTTDNGGGTGSGPVATGLWNALGDTLYTNNEVSVGIGTDQPDAPLTVRGQIHCEEIRVDLSIPAPDYVFDESYDLISLDDLEAYISEHKHLPYLPEGQTMDEQGANIGQNQYSILRTLEEMVLHQIKLQKELDLLKAENLKLREKFNHLSH